MSKDNFSSATDALKEAYKLLKPFSDKQNWEFDNELSHLEYVSNKFAKNILILDVGCGIGLLGVSLSLMGYRVHGIDKFVFQEYSSEQSVLLKKVWDKVGFQVVNGDILRESSNAKYDLVTSIAVIEHQPYPKIFLESLIKYLNNDGALYIATPNILNGLNRFRVLFGRAPMGNIRSFFMEEKNFYGHWREYSLEEVKTMISLCGLKIVDASVVQSSWPRIRVSRFTVFHRWVFQILARIVPGWGDTVRVLAK